MAAAEGVQFSLKVTMIKESSKVLYAEVDSDFADVLLSFLTLPLGTIVRLLRKHYGKDAPILGSLNSLYAGLLDLDSSHFWREEGKLMLFNPRNSSGDQCSRLKLQIDDTPPIQYFACQEKKCVSMYYEMTCFCSDSINTYKTKDVVEIESESGEKGVFTEKTSSFILTDDLEIMTNSPASIFQILKLRGVEDTKLLEVRTLVVGSKEIMELLKASLVSKTPITDVVFPTTPAAATSDERKKFIATSPRTQNYQNITNSDPEKHFSVKAYVQKSTNRILLAQTRHDFVDFLFSFLIIPLGRVQSLLEDKPLPGSIQTFYRTVSSSENFEYMKSSIRTTLLHPKIPPHYLSLYQIFSLNQQTSPPFRRWYKRTGKKAIFASRLEPPHSFEVDLQMIDPKGRDSFVRGPALFVVTDDLVVSAASSTSIVSILNHMNVPLSDVVEQELGIDVEEALSILQASLTSTSALTDGFKPFLKTQLKQEK